MAKRGRPKGSTNKPTSDKINSLIEKAIKEFVGSHRIEINVSVKKLGRRGRKAKT